MKIYNLFECDTHLSWDSHRFRGSFSSKSRLISVAKKIAKNEHEEGPLTKDNIYNLINIKQTQMRSDNFNIIECDLNNDLFKKHY